MYYFIYETTNLINGKKYRGAHQTLNINDGYLGSGAALGNAIKKYGRSNFTRRILCFCLNTDDMIRKESEYVDESWVARKDTYNLQTGGLNYGILSEDSKKKISETLKRKYQTGELEPSRGRLGLDPWNKGKVGVYSEETIKLMAEKKENYIPWNKGKVGVQIPWNKDKKIGPMSDEQKQQISSTLKERYKTHEHPRKGKPPWCAGTKGQGIVKAWNKGIPQPEFECKYCGKKVKGKGNLTRWHNENCRHKP